MSFLNSVLLSIETGDVSVTPPPATRKPLPGPSHSVVRPSPDKKVVAQSNVPAATSRKRRAEDGIPLSGGLDKISRSSVRSLPQISTSATAIPAKPQLPAKPVTFRSTVKPSSTAPQPGTASVSVQAKAPLKGSFADMMLRAKALQEKTPMQVGMIRHQASSRERVSRIQQKRLALEARQRETLNKKAKKSGMISKGVADKPKDERIFTGKSRVEPEYKGTARPAQDSSTPMHRGTARLPSHRITGSRTTPSKSQTHHSHGRPRDEYLGTDEEDDYDDYGRNNYDDGFSSDESTDMEAGIFDVEEEERRALQMAKREDEAELKTEMAAKNAKLDRKRKPVALPAKFQH